MTSSRPQYDPCIAKKTGSYLPPGVQLACWAASLVCFLAATNLSMSAARAEEPYRQFLAKLSEAGLHKLALVYLDDLEKTQRADPEFAKEIPLERANLYQSAASTMSPRSPGRIKRLDEAERAFQTFLNKEKDHPRRSEARVGLGNLLLARAEEVKEESDPKAARPEAIKYYTEAEKLFESTQVELKAILEKMQGARVDAKDEAKKELRDKLRGDYRRAELLTAFSTEHKGRSYAQGSNEWKQELEKAQKAYTEFYTHEKDRQEARNIALFYRSGIQRDFQKLDDAADGYNRILGIEGIDELRPLQYKSLTELIKIWASKEQNKYAAVIDLITRWEKTIRPDERNSQDVIDFQLAATRAKLDYAGELQTKNADDRSIPKLRRDARDDLQRMVKITGPHQQAARELMAQLGMAKDQPATPVELPQVKNFADAIKEATTRFETLQTEMVTQQTLQDSLDKEADAAKKQELSGQLSTVNETISRLQEQTAELYSSAIRMFPRGGDAAEINDVRYRLAYVELMRGRPRAAIAIGEFLAQMLAGDPTGLQAATVALAGYGKLITAADLETQKRIATQLQPFAEFMVATWPEATQSQAAASTLVQLAMNAGDIAKAQAYVDKLPGGSGKADALRRDIGARLAQEYFQEKLKITDGGSPSPELVAKRDASIAMLQAGLKGVKKDAMDATTIEAINSLVRLYLTIGKVEDATQWMNSEIAPVTLLRAKPDLVDQRLVKLDSYRTALQATVSQLSDPKANTDDLLKEIEKLIGELGKTAGSDADGSKMLTAIYVSVARDLQDLVEGSKTPAIKQKLADGMVLICKQVADSSTEFNTKFWAGSTLSKVASALDASADKTKQQLVRESSKLLQEILDKEAATPGWIGNPNGEISVRAFLAQSLRQAGQYQQAIDQLAKVLEKKDGSLELQVAAAEAFQAWADSGAKEKYEQAINGDVSNKKGGRVIWGWKGMSNTLNKALPSNEALKPAFFNARYNLSLCLYRQALAEAGKKTELLGKAEREIGTTRFLHKDMGGPENYKRFDALLKNIQKEQGK